MTPFKPILFWAFWPDDLSRAMEKYFVIRYCQPEAIPAPKWNYELPSVFDVLEREGGRRPDALFLHGWSLCDSLFGLDRLDVPAVAYFHDAHFDLNSWMWDFSQSFDWVWMDTRESAEYFVRRGSARPVTYCPVYYKGTRDRISEFIPWRERPIDVAFIGNWSKGLHPGRHAFFKSLMGRLEKRVRFHVGTGDYEAIYPESKIVLNDSSPAPLPGTGRHVYDAPNFRVFEAMGCGALLLCDSPGPSITSLFGVGRDMATYEHENVDDAAAKVEFYLAHERDRHAIAESGWRCVVDHHTPEARADMLAQVLLGFIEGGRRPARMDPDAHFLLGRSILRQGLIWRGQAPSIGHPVFEERMLEARRLMEAGLGSERYRAMAGSLLPLVPHLLGRREEAVEGWKKLKATASHVFAAAFLAGCAVNDTPLRSEVESFGPGPSGVSPSIPEEFEVLKEVLGGSVFLNARSE